MLKGLVLPQNDADFEDRFWRHCAGEFRGIDDLTIVGTYHFIVTPSHVAISIAIFAVAFDDVVKALACRVLQSDRFEDEK